jgi:hypothetical protein
MVDMLNKTLLIVLNIIVFDLGLCLVYKKHHQIEIIPIVQKEHIEPIPIKPEPIKPINYIISNPNPSYLDNEATVNQLVEWHQEAPKLTEIGTYGKTSIGKDIYYIRVTNPETENKKVVLITACIHGNEPLSSSTIMSYIGTMLDKYGDDSEITELIDTRDIYFVPIVSPDSYPNKRHVDGVDPNRDFPTMRIPEKTSVPPVMALREFFLKIKPDAVISGHTSGRVYLTPWGDRNQVCPNESDYKRIIGEMSGMSGYDVMRACQIYNSPIYGGEVDWYYRHSSFSIVCEFGTHQNIPTTKDTREEFDLTFKAFLHFCKEAPLVKVLSKSEVKRAA